MLSRKITVQENSDEESADEGEEEFESTTEEINETRILEERLDEIEYYPIIFVLLHNPTITVLSTCRSSTTCRTFITLGLSNNNCYYLVDLLHLQAFPVKTYQSWWTPTTTWWISIFVIACRLGLQ